MPTLYSKRIIFYNTNDGDSSWKNSYIAAIVVAIAGALILLFVLLRLFKRRRLAQANQVTYQTPMTYNANPQDSQLPPQYSAANNGAYYNNGFNNGNQFNSGYNQPPYGNNNINNTNASPYYNGTNDYNNTRDPEKTTSEEYAAPPGPPPAATTRYP